MNIGFDLWGTLMKSNPLFKEAKKILFKKYFPEYTPKECDNALEYAKRDLNSLIESSGMQPARGVMLNQFYYRLTGSLDLSSVQVEKKLREFDDDYQKLVLIFPPLWYDKNSLRVLTDLLLSDEHLVYIITNTLFIDGQIIKNVFLDKNLSEIPIISSSNRNVSKPHPKIVEDFRHPLDLVIGDNLITDGGLARNLGIDFFQINTNNKTIIDAYKHIESASN